MDVETASLFFALLSLVALVGVLALVAIGLVSWRSGGSRLTSLRDDLGRVALWLAFAVALTCTLGSLYFSEIAKFTPCKLCWFQRIAMYPLVLLLGIAAVRRDREIRVYAVAQAAVGAVIAAYHTWLQAFPTSSSSFCTVDAPCTERHVWELGFISIPFMSLAGFSLIIALLWVGLGSRPNIATPDHHDEIPDEGRGVDMLVGSRSRASEEPTP